LYVEMLAVDVAMLEAVKAADRFNKALSALGGSEPTANAEET
jgi:hypothetical protein